MIIILPGYDVIKCHADNNIDSDGATLRVKALYRASDLMTRSDTEVVICGTLFERFRDNWNEDQQEAVRSLYHIDNSTIGLPKFDHSGSLKWIATRETSSGSQVIILTDKVSECQVDDPNVTTISCPDFLIKVEKASELERRLDSLNASLMCVFFSQSMF